MRLFRYPFNRAPDETNMNMGHVQNPFAIINAVQAQFRNTWQAFYLKGEARCRDSRGYSILLGPEFRSSRTRAGVLGPITSELRTWHACAALWVPPSGSFQSQFRS